MTNFPIPKSTGMGSGRPPDETEKVVCPDAVNKRLYPPKIVYEGIEPDGKKKVLRVIIADHQHKDFYGAKKKENCPWSGHTAPIVRDGKKETASLQDSSDKEVTRPAGVLLSPNLIWIPIITL